MTKKKFSWKERFKSFTYAWAGIKQAFVTEHNTWIHLFLTFFSFLLGVILHISRIEWIALIIVISMVWTAELFNTALEKTMDFISRERHPMIKLVKDLAAAAVLITAIAAVLVGCFIFLPKIF